MLCDCLGAGMFGIRHLGPCALYFPSVPEGLREVRSRFFIRFIRDTSFLWT